MSEATVTKPQKPRRRIIERPRLTRLLDESPARIKMLIAPAGYGKTTLARQWLEANRLRAGWCTCTAASRDVAVLLAQVQCALREVGVSVDRTMERARSARDPLAELDALLDLLVADAPTWPDGWWLVLDDYHELLGAPHAERVVEALVSRTPASYLIAGRRRPPWASGRRLLYGDVTQVRRRQLAMTADEVAALVGPRGGRSDALTSLARGWPAIVGLAAMNPTVPVPEFTNEEALYEYLATEIYAAASDSLQELLRTVAFARESHGDLIRELAPEGEGRRLESEAIALGFLAGDGAAGAELHPLLQDFLRRRCLESGEREVRRAFSILWTLFKARGAWDDAFALILYAGVHDELPNLVRASLDQMLASARLASIDRWLAFGRSQELDDPILTLAEAEVALRRGSLLRAQALGVSAAASYEDDPSRAARGWCVAGRAAHLRAADEDALQFFERALDEQCGADVTREAAWGRFVSAVDLELPESVDALASVTTLEPQTTADGLVKRWNAQLLFELRIGDLQSVNDATAAAAVVDRLKDPVKRAGFWSAYTNALTLVGAYEDSLRAAETFIEDAQRFRVDFALPYAHEGRAAALVGLCRYDEAEHQLAIAEAAVRRAPDAHVVANAQAIRSRMLVAQGLYGESLKSLAPVVTEPLSRSMRGELLACRALALACLGDTAAVAAADAAIVETRAIEARVLAPCARAILASVRSDNDLRELARAAFDAASSSNNVDSLIASYRAHPGLLTTAHGVDELWEWTYALLLRAGDAELANTFDRPAGGAATLTPRESEIHALLAEGLRNKEIAAKLFLSEATVKLHVHRVLEKLGVRSRTAAARLFISQRSRP